MRANSVASVRRVARAQAVELKERRKLIERGIVAGTVEAMLEVKSRQFDGKAADAKAKRGLRGEKKAYVRAVVQAKQFITVGSKAHSSLLSDLASPFLKDLEEKVGRDLAMAEQHYAQGNDGVVKAVQETVASCQEAFRAVARDWGLLADEKEEGSGSSGGGGDATAIDLFSREAQRVVSAEEAKQKHAVLEAKKSQHLTLAAAQIREDSFKSSQLLVVDNDYMLYRIPPPASHPEKVVVCVWFGVPSSIIGVWIHPFTVF